MEYKHSGIYFGYIIVASVFLIMVVMWGTVTSFGVFFESLLKEFGWTRALTSGASSLRNLVFGPVCIATAGLAEQSMQTDRDGALVFGGGLAFASHKSGS